MSRGFDVPDYVQTSIDARDRAAARRATKTCVYTNCSEPAYAARGGSAARCAEHDAQEFTPPPIPDPARTLSGLRAAAGLRAESFSIGRTSFDEKAERKGQRVSAARRAQARGAA